MLYLNKKILLVLVVFLFFPICLIAQSLNKAQIDFAFDQIESGTKMYLIDTMDDFLLDSVLVSDRKFLFRLPYYGKPRRLVVRDPANKYLVGFFVDTNKMSVHVQNGEPAFMGSETMLALDTFKKETQELETQINTSILKSQPVKTDSLEKKRLEISLKYINKDKSFFSLTLLLEGLLDKSISVAYAKEIIKKYPDRFMESGIGKLTSNFINKYKPLKTRDKAPSFSTGNKDEIICSLEKYKGKYLLLTFWASWCSPCLREFSSLNQFYENNRDKIEIIGISLDRGYNDFKNTISRHSLKWQNFNAPQGWFSDVAILYGISSLPTNVLISPEGVILNLKIAPEHLLNEMAK